MSSDNYDKNRKKINDILLRRHSYNKGVIVIDDELGGFMIGYDGVFNCNNFVEGVDNVE